MIDPGTAAVVGSAISGIGGILSNRGSRNAAREQMRFQERMSNTQWQRGVLDMKAAGLNPMLAYSQGGASAPMGSMPNVQNVGDAAVSGAKSGIEMTQTAQLIAQNKALTEQTQAMTAKIQSETLSNSLHSAKLVADTAASASQSPLNFAKEMLTAVEGDRAIEELRAMRQGGFAADVEKRKAEARIATHGVAGAQAEADFYKGLGQHSPMVRLLLEMLRGLTGAAGAASRWRK